MKKIVTLEKKESLFVKVYHIGYSSQGEGIIFILYTSGGKVLYSLAIDCFEEVINVTDEILKKWKLEKKLNMFIWTHPHDDHSVGVNKIIEKYCSKDSIICTADIFKIREKCSTVCKENIDCINKLVYHKTVRNKGCVKPLSHFPDILDKVYFNGECDIKKLQIQCISPFQEIGGMQGLGKDINFNMIGIGCVLNIELQKQNLNFLFAGDMELYTIEKLIEQDDESLPNVYNYIKIPHHGSENAENMLNFLSSDEGIKSQIATTSIFKKKKLPRKNVIEKYKNAVEMVGCTSDINNDKYGLGVISLNYDLSLKKVVPEFYGTASCL